MLDRCVVVVLALLALAAQAPGQDLKELRVGHWVRVKGAHGADARFDAASIEVVPPERRHVLRGTVESVDPAARTFRLLGREIVAAVDVRLDDGLQLAELACRRVEVEARWRGAESFEAREIGSRGPGRDLVAGRVDALDAHGELLRLAVAGFVVELPRTAEIENETSFATLELAPEIEAPSKSHAPDDEDFVPGAFVLFDGLTLGILVESKYTHEEDFDLDADRERDIEKARITLRPELQWKPDGAFSALFSPRIEWNHRDKENGDAGSEVDLRVRELWGAWRGVGGVDLEVQVGRIDYDDEREWIYKRNLDAVRVVWRALGLRLDASFIAQLGEQDDPYDREAENALVVLSNDDDERHVAVWMLDRRAGGTFDSYPIHFGARALGEWVDGLETWIEGSIVRGYEQDVNLSGHGFDVGGVWQPRFLGPVYVSAGFAFGSGDDGANDGTDESFRQTGWQRNNGKLGGVTSFRYYGEVVDPELSNLGVSTLGIGTRLGRDASIDLVWHEYRQDVAADFLRDSELDEDPDGVHRDLGREIDLVAGLRNALGSDFELVLGWFEPGDALPDADAAWKVSLQWRYRF